MGEIETLGITEEIRALVSDKLQVVSYKWLSRNFLLSSNAAKRFLQEFVEKDGSGLEVVYTLSGWLKNDLRSYHIRLVTEPKLQEAKQEFDDNCSVQVYSVQASIPKDPAALWNVEYVQAEELFKQPTTVDNCLRDNRFCGISNSFVKRNVNGVSVSTSGAQSKNTGVSEQHKSNFAQQNITVRPPQQEKVQESRSTVGLPSPSVVKDVKSENNGVEVCDQDIKCSGDKDKVPLLPINKKKGMGDKSSSGAGSSLANMWGRASAKSNPSTAQSPLDDNHCKPKPNVSAEAQICHREVAEVGLSDDDGECVNFQRPSKGEGGRKRRVVFDFSDDDEFEDGVNLASPDPPKGQSHLGLKENAKTLVSENLSLNCEEQKDEKTKVKEEKTTDKELNKSLKDSSVVSKSSNIKILENQSLVPENDAKKDKVTVAAPASPKRRKIVKTRIDERGREVNEVVWEGEESDPKKVDSNISTKLDHNTASDTANRPPAKKSPAVANTAAAKATGKGNKKGAPKDPKQGNILTFFKKAG